MCGIAGLVGKNIAEAELLGYLKQLSYGILKRGPDANSVFYKELDNDIRVGLAHARLSIIDLDSRSNQPMHFNEFSIVFNGEIYNYRNLRFEMESQGFIFRTSGDTEVLLFLYIKYGEKMLSKLEGMFAFVIFDFKNCTCFGAVDRFGVKPLYYSLIDGRLFFASQLKSFSGIKCISKEISLGSVNEFLHQGYISSPRTIFSSVMKMEPGSFFHFNFNEGVWSLERFWRVEDYRKNRSVINFKDRDGIVSDVENILFDSFSKRLVADVPIGVFLSGGLDSTTLAGYLAGVNRDIETFTVKFPFGVDESVYARNIAEALGLRHSVLTLDNSITDYIEDFIEAFDEPFADSSALPMLMICKAAKERVKVVLTGDGGDEIFGGYNYLKGYLRNVKIHNSLKFSYRFLENTNLVHHPKIRQVISADKSLYDNNLIHNLSFTSNVSEIINIFTDITKVNYYDKTYDKDPLKHALQNDILNYLPGDILVKSDRASMYYGLEVREPYLSPELTDYILQLPSQVIYTATTKNLLRSINSKFINGKMLVPKKQGFEIPMNYWLKNDLSFLIENYLLSQNYYGSGFFDKRGLIELYHRFCQNKVDYTILWRVLVFEMWFKRWN